jgi:MFS family permease
MFSWGLLSGAMAFVRGENSFYAVRVLLGIAEAGFFPGIIFYLTLWFPAVYRARIIGYFMAAIPLSTVIGAPVSGWLLGFDGHLGLKGWQWLFILEAAPALVLSFVVFFYLTDRPADATWLQPDERAWLMNRMDQERLNLAQRLEHEIAYVHFGVGDFQIIRENTPVPVKENIQIQRAFAPTPRFDAVREPLRVLAEGKQFLGREVGANFKRAV